ncbi:MAG TPA: tetratricopeptide repeat protein [Terriglobales bacterium]
MLRVLVLVACFAAQPAPLPGQTAQPQVPQSQAAANEPHYVPPGPAKCVEIGNFYLKRKSYKAALSRFQEAAKTNPEYAPAYLGLGKTYEKLGRPQDALDAYHRYLDLLPSDKDAEEAKDVQRAIKRLNVSAPTG